MLLKSIRSHLGIRYSPYFEGKWKYFGQKMFFIKKQDLHHKEMQVFGLQDSNRTTMIPIAYLSDLK
jgi:hypothetical protein